MKTFGSYLPAVKIQYNKFQNEVFELTSKNQMLESEIYGLNNTINSSYDFLKSIQAKCIAVEKERNSLAIQKLRLLGFASEFENNSEIMTKVSQFVENKVNSILRENMKILEISLVSVLEAFEDDPNSFRYLLDRSISKLGLTNQKKNHIVKQRTTDYCYACYDSNSEQISLRYFDNLKKRMVSEIGLGTERIMGLNKVKV